MVARSRGPCYDISDLVRDCSFPGRVIVRKTARESAKQHFDLITQERIIDFVSNGVFEEIEYENTDEIDEGSDSGATFDAHIFRIGPKHVYFAFYKRSNGIWVIKSFHPPEYGNKAPLLSHNPFASLEVLK